MKINIPTGINYLVGFKKKSFLEKIFLSNTNTIKEDLLFIRNKLNCKSIRIAGIQIDNLIKTAKLAKDLGITPWLSPRFINSSFEDTKKSLGEFCLKAKEADLSKEPLFVANELVLDCSDLAGKEIAKWIDRVNTVLREVKNGKIYEVTNKVMALVGIARGSEWKGGLSYASFMYETVNWDKIADDNLFVSRNLYWERDIKNGGPEKVEAFEEKIKKVINAANGRPVIISEYGAVPHKDGLAVGGGGFMLRGKPDYESQKKALSEYYKVFDKYKLGSFLFCFYDKTEYSESSYGIVKKNAKIEPLPAAEEFAKFVKNCEFNEG